MYSESNFTCNNNISDYTFSLINQLILVITIIIIIIRVELYESTIIFNKGIYLINPLS